MISGFEKYVKNVRIDRLEHVTGRIERKSYNELKHTTRTIRRNVRLLKESDL